MVSLHLENTATREALIEEMAQAMFEDHPSATWRHGSYLGKPWEEQMQETRSVYRGMARMALRAAERFRP